MNLKNALFFVYALITLVLFATFRTNGIVWASFFLSSLIVTGLVIFHIYFEKAYSPFLSAYIVFNFLFFIVAPVIQLNSLEGIKPLMVNSFPYKEDLVIHTNVLISIFNSLFFIFYMFFKKRAKNRKPPTVKASSQKILPVTIIWLTGLSLIILVLSYQFVQDEIGRPSWQKSVFSVSEILIWKKVLFMTPFAGLILCFQYFSTKRKNAINVVTIAAVLLLCLAIVFWFKNPFTEKRNALGPIYICILFLAYPKLLNSNIKSLSFLFFTLVVLFPLSAILTHTDASFQELISDPSLLLEYNKGGGIATAFNTLNYDAFANIMATIEYVQHHGFAMGFQLLSALLFFVPRGVWASKPISTGEQVGQYLIDDYGFTYNNLSNPMVSEGYINFGVFGVILLAGILAYFLVFFIGWLKSEDYLKRIMAFYLAIHLIFLLRGDFTNGYTYYVGTFIGVLIIPRAVEFFIKQLLLNQKKWKRLKT